MGKSELILPMLLGAALAMFVDARILYKLFDSKLFPASGTWAPGVATAQSILAGDKGGKRAGLLGIGTTIGIVGSFLHIPMSAFGVAFIGNIWALTMFGIGLMIRHYLVPWFGVDVNQLYIAHGIMIGAGIVALIQVSMLIFGKQKKSAKSSKFEVAATLEAVDDDSLLTRPINEAKKALGIGFVLYLVIALIIAYYGRTFD